MSDDRSPQAAVGRTTPTVVTLDLRTAGIFVASVLGLTALQGAAQPLPDTSWAEAVRALTTVVGGGLSPVLAVVVTGTLLFGWSATWAVLRRGLRRPDRWWPLASAIAVPVVAVVVALLLAGGGGHADAVTTVGPVLLAQVLVMGPLFALAENLGWRAWLQTSLRSCFGVLTSGAVVGVVWALWHAPLFLFELTPTHADLPFLPFAAALVAFSLFLARLYDATGPSLFPVVVGHVAYNVSVGLALDRTDDPTGLLWLVAAIVLALAVVPIRRSGRPRGVGGSWGVLAVALGLALVVTACGEDPPPVSDESTTEDVVIPADGVDLAGTLWLPAGPGPHPAAVIVHGSGPQSRRGLAPGQLGLTFPQPVPVYEQLAAGLAEEGVAVLSYDKRTCGPFNGCADNDYPAPADDLTFATFVADLDAAIDQLVARDDLDGVVAIGHSMGGTVAAQLTRERDDLAGLVLLAAPAPPIDEVLATQADTLAELIAAVGQSGPDADRAVTELRELADEVASIADGPTDGGPVGGASRAFWRSWVEASRTAPSLVVEGDVPVLVVGGGSDWNVPPEQVEAWRPYLAPDERVELLPGITHALTRLDADDPAAITPADVGGDVGAAVIDVIADWVITLSEPG